MKKYLNSLWLAPMAGFTDSAFRQICLQAGAGLVTTEMVSTKGLVYNSDNTKTLLFSNGLESKTAVQLFGAEPEFFAEAVQMPELEPFPIIDINMGCPVHKVVKTGAGSALLKDLNLASKIIKACTNNTKKLVTVKFRIGWDETSIVATDFAKMCQDSGASAVCIHGRTQKQLYGGQANWQIIADTAKQVSIPVIGNGDITTSEQAKNILNTSPVQAVAIGRGALGNPWIFSEFKNSDFTLNRLEVIKQNYLLMLEYCPQERVVPAMRGQLNFYLKKLKLSAQVRNELNKETDLNKIFAMLENLL